MTEPLNPDDVDELLKPNPKTWGEDGYPAGILFGAPVSYLATLKREGDEYVRDGVNIGTWVQALGDVLGFCACGHAEGALLYVLNILRLIAEKCPDDAQWDDWYKGHRARAKALFHDDLGAEYLAYYLLDDKGLTEHGSSVPGWLTDRGRGILADLEAHVKELEAET